MISRNQLKLRVQSGMQIKYRESSAGQAASVEKETVHHKAANGALAFTWRNLWAREQECHCHRMLIWILIIILSIWYSHILISEYRAQWQALSPNLLVPPRFYNWACSIKSEIDSWFIQIFNIYNVNHPDTWCLWKKCLSQIIKIRLANHFMGFKTSVTSLKISCRVSLHNEHISTPGQTQK